MRSKLPYVAAAAALAGFLGFGGVSLAYAQDSSSSSDTPTTTQSPSTTNNGGSTTTPQQGDQNVHCPNMGGSSGNSNSSSSAQGTSL
jgi:hypothetical protein